MKYAVVEIDLGTDLYQSYSGIRCLKIFDRFKEAQNYLEQEEIFRKWNYSNYLSQTRKMAEKILKEDPNKESKIVKNAYFIYRDYSKIEAEKIIEMIDYILRGDSKDYPEYDVPEKPLFPDQFELDIVDINL